MEFWTMLHTLACAKLRGRGPSLPLGMTIRCAVVIPAVTHKICQTLLSFRAESRNLWLET